jgi:hypothetical protein
MSYITYENYKDRHVTIHCTDCGQIKKHGGFHRYGQGKYESHVKYEDAIQYAKSTNLPLIICSFCKTPLGR